MNKNNKHKISYNSCRICGSQPTDDLYVEPNYGPLRFWEPDDGWIIGTLCSFCLEEYGDKEPHPDDYAYDHTSGVVDLEDTDEDVSDILFEMMYE